MRKRILSLLLCIVLCLSLMPMSAFAQELPSMQNVRINPQGILSWDEVSGSAGYYVGIKNGETIRGDNFATSSGVNLNSFCRRYSSICDHTGDYTVVLYAWDSHADMITEIWTGSYHFVLETQQQTTYTVTFDMNGHGDSITALTVNEGDQLSKPADPVAEGWKFEGWYTDEALTEGYVFGALVFENITLHAKWTEIEHYIVTYDANGGTGSMPSERIYMNSEGKAIYSFPTCGFTAPEGKKFDHWEVEGNNNTFSEADQLAIFGDVIVKPIWVNAEAENTIESVTVTNQFSPDAGKLIHTEATVVSDPANVVTLGERHWETESGDPAGKVYNSNYKYHFCVEVAPKGGYQFEFDSNGNYLGTAFVGNVPAKIAKASDTVEGGLYIESEDIETSIDTHAGTFTVTFDMNGHGEQIPAQIVPRGFSVAKPADPVAEGWKFLGWEDESRTPLRDDYFDHHAVQKDETFKARWEKESDPNVCTVAFILYGHGTPIPRQDLPIGSKVTKPQDPTAEGWIFKGWYKDYNLNTPWDFDTDTVSEYTPIFAKWEEGIAPKIIESLNVNVNAPVVGSHPDYSPVITATPNEVTSLCKVYLTPAWICADTESDLYNGNGTVMTAADTFEAGKYYAFSIQVNTLDAIVAGWQRSSTIVVTINGSAIDSLNHNVLVNTFGEDIGWLRAVWKMPDAGATATYTVNFNMNGHGTQVEAQTVKEGEKATKPADPTEIGYMFVGWYKDSAFNTVWNFDTDTVTENSTLYALWAHNIPPQPITHNVTFNMNGHGDQVASQTVNEGAKATKPSDPTASGYTFDGWYADATFSAVFDFDTAIAADTTIYAKWTANSVTPTTPANYTVTFNMNGHGTQVAAQTVKEGEKANKPADPSASGYTFDGWYADATFSAKFNFDSAITANTTVYAKWTEVKKDEPTKPATPSKPTKPTKPAGPTSPQTGDNSHLFLWVALLFISSSALAGTAVYGKKRKYNAK